MQGDNSNIKQELELIPDEYPNMQIRYMHVQIAPDAKEGRVKAGDLIGLVLANQSFDLAISIDIPKEGSNKIDGNQKSYYISYFDVLPDSLFAKYQARGVKDRSQLIITKHYRDAHPYKCQGVDDFAVNYLLTEPWDVNVVRLSGYETVVK